MVHRRHPHFGIRRYIGRKIIKAHPPGLFITQAGHCYFGWHHRSGAHHKEAIEQGYPPQLDRAASTVPLLSSLLIGIKFPVNFRANAQNSNTAWGLTRAPIQKQKNSLLNSLLIPNNRENPPSPNELLSKGAKIADITASVEASDKTAVCIVLKQRSNSGDYGKLC